ncbi:NAD-dependent epimerase/dehydratase family protein [Nonlabens sp. SY33080]|uniref:NAD-dependent epimerase/dehydratase family protein n=1 Tax=Nonlabens sp. SY33080 TaxID=2719911 RepID=UPI001428CDA5|nr:NAD-dependent epimerase/dehydratase family protein [Nonlabens sp. SY33080]
MGYSAIIIGATGLCGSVLLEKLLQNEQYDSVITLSRKRINHQNPKHKNYIVDLFDPSTYVDHLHGDHLFICTGTTQSKTPDKAEYYKIEHDLPLLVAQQAKDNEISTVIAISALGANPESRFLYNRGKGEMERDIKDLNFKAAYFVQPALISGPRDEKRPFESMWKKVQKLIDPLLVGPLKKYRSIAPKTIATAMILIALHGYEKSRIESDELIEIANVK